MQIQEGSIAFDRATVRSYDVDNRLHVSITPISKSNVCPYVGREIPDWEKLGLQADKVYNLLRDPDELAKAAPTFNNLPLLSEHVPVNADNHQPDLVIGSTGTNAEFKTPYLVNSLVLWAKNAIDAVESEQQKELSSAYRYRAEMTPGNYEGSDYDGIMRDIVGNHVALVREGRAGSDVVVGDSKDGMKQDDHISKEFTPMAVKLSRKAALVQGGLTVFLQPKLAKDAKLDLPAILKDVTGKNYAEQKTPILDALKPHLAKDAKIEDVHNFLDSLDKEQPVEDIEKEAAVVDEPEAEPKGMDEESAGKVKEFLKGKISEDDMKALDAMMRGDEPPAFEGEPKTGATDEDDKEKKEMVDKPAMDAAIAVATKAATDAANKNQMEIRNAERSVRPYVGEIAIAHDSPDAVYRTALTTLGMDAKDIADLPLSALKVVLKTQPLPGVKPKTNEKTFAMDAAQVDDFNKRFPGAVRIGNLG